MDDLKYEITKAWGVFSGGSKGWQKEINMVSWNEREPKIDIRDWGLEHEKIGKGITLNNEELKKLKVLLDGFDLEVLEIE